MSRDMTRRDLKRPALLPVALAAVFAAAPIRPAPAQLAADPPTDVEAAAQFPTLSAAPSPEDWIKNDDPAADEAAARRAALLARLRPEEELRETERRMIDYDPVYQQWLKEAEATAEAEDAGDSLSPNEPRVAYSEAVEGRRFPYAVALMDDGVLRCSGVLVGRDIVLTAAHCFCNFDPDTVLFGNQIHSDTVAYSVADRRALKGNKFKNAAVCEANVKGRDLAVLRLEREVDRSHARSVLKMPNGLEFGAIRRGANAVVMGFGNNENLDRGMKRFAYTPITNHDCSEIPGPSNGSTVECEKGKELVASRIEWDARADPSGPCATDSGGPLRVVFGDRSRLAGLVSRGHRSFANDARCGAYGVYTRITKRVRRTVIALCEDMGGKSCAKL